MSEILTLAYRPRRHFKAFHASSKRWRYVVAHRRAGKTVCFVNDLIRAALRNQRELPPPRYAYIGPSFSQAKDLVWGYLKQYTQNIPDTRFSESELTCTLPNSAKISLYGGGVAYNRVRGLYLDGAVLDEFSLLNPEALNSVVRPALADYGGFGVVAGTPAGRDHFLEQKEKAEKQPDLWDVFVIPVTDTNALPQEELEEMQQQMSPHQYDREMLCSFEAPVDNAYYGDLLVRMASDGRICGVPHDPRAKVITGWDLGMHDLTSIWFMQKIGQELHFIDYYQNSGVGLDHYASILAAKGYTYLAHIFPHDIKLRELGTGRSRFEVALSLKMGGDILIAPDHSPADGIQAVRTLLPMAWFDKDKTVLGLDALRSYHAAPQPHGNTVRDAPAHTWASHGSDALRTLATGLHFTVAWAPGALKRRVKGVV